MAFYIPIIVVTVLVVAISIWVTREMRRAFTRFRSREVKVGKELIYRHFPRHKKPLGGGVAIFIALLLGMVLAWRSGIPVSRADVVILLCGLAFAGIGFIDDWRKVSNARGLGGLSKLLLQILFALIFTLLIAVLRNIPYSQPAAIFFPFIGWVVKPWLLLPFGVFIIVAAANAVNLTDGLDGLAGSSLAITFLGYLVLGLLHIDNLSILFPLLALAAITGFLVFNLPPAKIIMGDTGALGLGAVLGALALVSGTEWLLVLLAAPFVIDTLSVLIQVTVIKFFRGPVKLLRHQTTEVFRPFLCTPLHHHFQWLTWGPWPILALFSGVGILSGLLAVLASPAVEENTGAWWFWLIGIILLVAFLVFAALQKVVRATYFLGLEQFEGYDERVLALYKGLPLQTLGARWYSVEELTEITESMVSTIAAESILWRNISEIEARATLGKIYAEYKSFDKAVEQWEEIPLRNLLIRENIVVQLGKIYFGRDELLRAIKLWEQLPPSRLARVTGLTETIQSAKVRVGHLAGRLYHQAQEHITELKNRQEKDQLPPSGVELRGVISEMEGALRYTQDLRDLLAYEQHKAENAGELEVEGDVDLYRRMDTMLAARREELMQHLGWAQALASPAEAPASLSPLQELSATLGMTPAEISRALEVNEPLTVLSVTRVNKPSRNTLYQITLARKELHLPERLVAKCYQDTQVTFFSACYRRERGVLQLLQEVDAPVPRIFGGHLGSRLAVLFMEDLALPDLTSALQSLAVEDRAGRLHLLRHGLEALVNLRIHALPLLPRLEREIAKILKEVLTPEYYLNTTSIALNRILALEHRQLTTADRGQLELALRPLVVLLSEEPKTFIHFEFTPGNLHIGDQRTVAVDFEQATLGPGAFDLASLLYTPEANLSDAEIGSLHAYYEELLPADSPPAFMVRREVLETAAIVKMLFYAGSAANFYRKFEEGSRLSSMEWYLHTVDRLLRDNPAYHELHSTLRECWDASKVGVE